MQAQDGHACKTTTRKIQGPLVFPLAFYYYVYFFCSYNYGDSLLINIILLIGNMFMLPCISQATK